jgi:hypothetical protein
MYATNDVSWLPEKEEEKEQLVRLSQFPNRNLRYAKEKRTEKTWPTELQAQSVWTFLQRPTFVLSRMSACL